MISKFTDIGIPEDVAKAMDDMGWEEPTPIQVNSVPLGLKGTDMFAQAQTGTGKTGAYGSIILGTIESGRKVPSAIILVPTRELANQVSEELSKLAKYSGHQCIPIYGGASIEGQIKKLGQGCDIVAGTPGRVRDMITRKVLNLSEITTLVLDEADRMLDMGFVEDIEFILKAMPSERHTMLFSATMQENVKQLAFDYMRNPKEVSVSKDEVVLDLTKQYYISVGRRNKSWALCRILDLDKPKAIIFCQTKKMVDVLEERLTNLDYKVEAIHGDMPQSKREKVMADFKNDKTTTTCPTTSTPTSTASEGPAGPGRRAPPFPSSPPRRSTSSGSSRCAPGWRSRRGTCPTPSPAPRTPSGGSWTTTRSPTCTACAGSRSTSARRTASRRSGSPT